MTVNTSKFFEVSDGLSLDGEALFSSNQSDPSHSCVDGSTHYNSLTGVLWKRIKSNWSRIDSMPIHTAGNDDVLVIPEGRSNLVGENFKISPNSKIWVYGNIHVKN